ADCRVVWVASSSLEATALWAGYALSLHDALPISVAGSEAERRDVALTSAACRAGRSGKRNAPGPPGGRSRLPAGVCPPVAVRRRSEEHTSELQSRENLVCRLLLEKTNRTASSPGA